MLAHTGSCRASYFLSLFHTCAVQVIENPDHTYAYAAPTWSNQQQQQQQPYYHAPTAPGAYPTIPAQGTNPYAAP